MRADTKPRVKFNRRRSLSSFSVAVAVAVSSHLTSRSLICCGLECRPPGHLVRKSDSAVPDAAVDADAAAESGVRSPQSMTGALVSRSRFRFRFSYFEVHRCVNRRRLSHIRRPMSSGQRSPNPTPSYTPHTHAHAHTHSPIYSGISLDSAVDHLRFVPDEFRWRRTTIEASERVGRGSRAELLRLRTSSDSKCHVKHIN